MMKSFIEYWPLERNYRGLVQVINCNVVWSVCLCIKINNNYYLAETSLRLNVDCTDPSRAWQHPGEDRTVITRSNRLRL